MHSDFPHFAARCCWPVHTSLVPLPIIASEVSLIGSRGPVYGPLSFTIDAGEIACLVAGQGNGLSSLLLTIAGRMKPTAGQLQVGGYALPRKCRKVQRRSCIAGFEDIDDLDPALSCAELIYERISLASSIISRRPGWDGKQLMTLRCAVFGDDGPAPRTQMWDLSALQQLQVRLFMAVVDEPELICFDAVDQLRDPHDQVKLWESLVRVSQLGITVVTNSANTSVIPAQVRCIAAQRPGRASISIDAGGGAHSTAAASAPVSSGRHARSTVAMESSSPPPRLVDYDVAETGTRNHGADRAGGHGTGVEGAEAQHSAGAHGTAAHSAGAQNIGTQNGAGHV